MKNHITIIGAGIVGLATALKLKKSSPHGDAFGAEANITILEKEDGATQHKIREKRFFELVVQLCR